MFVLKLTLHNNIVKPVFKLQQCCLVLTFNYIESLLHHVIIYQNFSYLTEYIVWKTITRQSPTNSKVFYVKLSFEGRKGYKVISTIYYS